MLNQAASDRAKLAKLLNISNEQMSYVTNADAGCGLIRYGSALVPFINRFPRDTKLYALMTTKPVKAYSAARRCRHERSSLCVPGTPGFLFGYDERGAAERLFPTGPFSM